jgi:hypothetical protein
MISLVIPDDPCYVRPNKSVPAATMLLRTGEATTLGLLRGSKGGTAHTISLHHVPVIEDFGAFKLPFLPSNILKLNPCFKSKYLP